MIDLFPDGFEEVDHVDGIELVAYTNARGEERLWQAFGRASATAVEEGWEHRWRMFHRPVEVAGIWIGPPWDDPPPDTLSIVIDPGQAFGTGAHPTTRLVLGLLADVERGSLLDVGCGSGILSIAAAKLGFDPVTAIDIDERAIDATRRNAAANGVDIDVRLGDAQDAHWPAEVCVANVTVEVVDRLAERVDCAQLVTSGYLLSDEPRLERFAHVLRVGEEGWAADLYRRSAQ
jgi:ribosomal protein L11 methyltransferase